MEYKCILCLFIYRKAFSIEVGVSKAHRGVTCEPSLPLATLGAIIVAYGGSTSSQVDKSNFESASVGKPSTLIQPSAPLVGDVLTIIASIGYGLYQVLYKMYAALPSDPELVSEGLYTPIPVHDEAPFESSERSNTLHVEDAVYPPPFGFHPNMLTSAIGLCTFVVLWIPIPILHYLKIEPFLLPSNMITYLSIVGIALGGVVFNAGFMILLGIWGPIITSVGGLLTIVLVLFSDILFGAGVQSITVWSLTGSGVIVTAFGILAYNIFNER